MCLVKKPKVAVAATEKEAAILRNPYLDGLDPILRARTGGVKALTIRRDQTPSPNPLFPAPAPFIPPVNQPVSGGGGSGGVKSSLPGQGNLSDQDYERAVRASHMPGMIGIYGRATLSKAQQ